MGLGVNGNPANPSMWVFPKVQSVDGYLEPRIMRLDKSAVTAFRSKYGPDKKLNPYIWPSYFPQDVMYLDATNNSDIIVLPGGNNDPEGGIDYSTTNEAIRIRLAKIGFDFNDKDGFSGVDAQGNVTPWTDLFSSGYTLSQLIFNDKSDDTNYIFWVTLYRNARTLADHAQDIYGIPSTFLKVLFVGDINKNNMPDQPVILRNESNPSNLLRVPIIHMQCTPFYDRLQKYKMRDLVFNRYRDGNKAIVKEDTDGFPRTSHPNSVAFFAGFRVKTQVDTQESGPSSVSDTSGFDPGRGENLDIPDNFNIVNALLFNGGVGAQQFLTTENLTSWRSFGLHANAGPFDQWKYSWLGSEGQFANPPITTPWNCPLDSFRNGWYGISLRTIIRKIAEYSGCDPNILATFDRTIIGGSAEFNSANNGYDCKHRADTLDMAFVTNYNLLFGVDPRGMGIIGVSQSGEPSSNGAARVTVMFMRDASAAGTSNRGNLFGSQNQSGLVDGQEVLIEGSEEDSYNGIWTVANVNTYINAQLRWQQDFDLLGSTYIRDTVISHNHAPNGTASILMTSPVTYTDNDRFDSFVRDVLWQFVFKLKCPITQSGEFTGMPYMQFTSRWKQGQTLPTTWGAGTKFGKQPRKITSDCIKVSQRGDSGYVLCPPNGKLPPIEVPPLRWRTHQLGTKKGVYLPNLVYDSSTGKNWQNQDNTTYKYNTFGDNQHLGISLFGLSLTEPNGWILGSYLYEPYIDAPGSNPRYPSPVWDSWCDVNAAFPSGDWSGHYPLQALVWHGMTTDAEGALGGDINPSPNQFNAMYDVAREAALEFVTNKEMYVRDFLGLTYLDDPDGDYEDSWQEGGKQVFYRMENRIYNFFTGSIASSEWQASPVDKNGQLSYDSLDNAPEVEFFNGASTGVGGAQTSGTGDGAGNNTPSTPTTKFRTVTRKVTLYSATVVVKTFDAIDVIETYDTVNSRWVAQYGYLPEFDPDGSSVYGANVFVQFHYKGTEKGNCLIEGLSTAGAPDYWFSGIVQFKHGPSIGTDDSSIQYNLANLQWSEDLGKFLVQRPLEVANVSRRIYVAGRFVCDRLAPLAGVFGHFHWKTLTSDFPMSDKECYSKIDEDLLAPSAVVPTLTGGTNYVDITWGTRFKPVTLMAQAWGVNLTVNGHDWQIGANPVLNQTGGPNNSRINFWLNDWAGVAGSRHKILASAIDLDGEPQLDYYEIEFWGTLEIIGDNGVIA